MIYVGYVIEFYATRENHEEVVIIRCTNVHCSAQ